MTAQGIAGNIETPKVQTCLKQEAWLREALPALKFGSVKNDHLLLSDNLFYENVSTIMKLLRECFYHNSSQVSTQLFRSSPSAAHQKWKVVVITSWKLHGFMNDDGNLFQCLIRQFPQEFLVFLVFFPNAQEMPYENRAERELSASLSDLRLALDQESRNNLQVLKKPKDCLISAC